MDDIVKYQVRDGIAVVTMNRPEKRNALSGALVSALRKRLTTASEDDNVRIVVLTGSGSVFSAGADLAALKALQSATHEENLSDSANLAGLLRQIYLHPKPVIARVNGHAIAGGCGLAVACDYSIAVESAKLGFTEVRIGFVPAIVSVFVLRKVGETVARDLLLRGHLIPAKRAAKIGLITRSVAATELDDSVQQLAHEIAQETSATAVSQTKELISALQGRELFDALDQAVTANAVARETADCQAGIAAFLEKRDPPWKLKKSSNAKPAAEESGPEQTAPE